MNVFSMFKSDLKVNILSGFIIFLIALPLSVGISVASGAPPTAGLLSAIIGGIIGSFLSGSYVTISGPAAGLIVVILDAINNLGAGDMERGYKLMLAAVVFAGFLQILMGVFRFATYGLAVPINALHGMMAAIGITIITKQLYVLGGIKPLAKTTIAQIGELPTRIFEFNLEIFIVGFVCLIALIILGRFPKLSKIIPPSLGAVITGYILSFFIDIEHAHFVNIFNHEYKVGPEFLLHVPTSFSSYIQFPLFENVMSSEFISAVITISLVASIESVLSTYAVDKLDPLKRTSDLNKDLVAKGVCNTVLGFIGGLPIISEIVRSSANVYSGATQRSANFFHGLFIFIFLLLFPGVLNKIPLTTFAAILVFVGYRLAKPSQLLAIYKEGKSQVLVFLATIIITLSTDLLIGVLCGVLIELALNIYFAKSFIGLFTLNKKITTTSSEAVVEFNGPCVFTNLVPLKRVIESQKVNIIKLNFMNHFMDFSTKEILLNLKSQLVRDKKQLIITGADLSKNGSH